jgi:hypothetical protein
LIEFYAGFRTAANVQGIAESEAGKVLERAQKSLWAFGQAGNPATAGAVPWLALEREPALGLLKFPRPEETFALLARLGLPVEYETGGAWSAAGKLKASLRIRLVTPLAQALRSLAAQCAARSPRPKAVYERFLRANPQSVLAGEKPPLDLPPDAPAILANLPAPAAEAWQDLVDWLAGFSGFAPQVEFRSIHHGLWVANYTALRGGRDLCGLIVQDGQMTVRIILYRAGHVYVKERLDEFGPLIEGAFQRAHYYEEFEHQWLFIPIERMEDLVGVKKLLGLMAALMMEK